MFLAIFHTVESLSDEKLLEKYRSSGNSWYVGELYKRYTKAVAGVCYSYFKDRNEAEDTVMEIFELVISDLKKYEVQTFKPWLFSVVRHYCLRKKEKSKKAFDHHQDLKKNPDYFMESSDELSLSFLDGQVSRDMHVELEKAIAQLKDEQRICVELFFLQDKSYQEISTITGYSLNNVKSHIQNGKRNLKILLESQNG